MNLTKLVLNNNKFRIPFMTPNLRVVAIGLNKALLINESKSLTTRSFYDTIQVGNNLHKIYDLIGDDMCKLYNCTYIGDDENRYFYQMNTKNSLLEDKCT